MAKVLWVGVHPDDLEYMAAGPIVKHAAHNNHMLILTDGTDSAVLDHLNGVGVNSWWGVAHNPACEGYEPLTVEEFGAARLAESTNALNCLGSLTIHYGHLFSVTAESVTEEILRVADLITDGPVRLKTHTHIVDNHPDHITTGLAARALASADPARFGDLRHYIHRRYHGDPRLSQVVEKVDPVNADQRARAINSMRALASWSPRQGTLAIAPQSTPDLWEAQHADPKYLYHA